MRGDKELGTPFRPPPVVWKRYGGSIISVTISAAVTERRSSARSPFPKYVRYGGLTYSDRHSALNSMRVEERRKG